MIGLLKKIPTISRRVSGDVQSRTAVFQGSKTVSTCLVFVHLSGRTVKTKCLTAPTSALRILSLGRTETLGKCLGVGDIRIDEPTSAQKFVADNGPPAALAGWIKPSTSVD